MSQPLSPTPAPADVAGTLSATRVAQPDLTNRREIPLSSFDFLAGAYRATKRARSVSVAVLVVVALVGFANVFNGFRTGLDVNRVRSEIRKIESDEKALIEEFGASATGIATADILDRDRVISTGLVSVTASQGDFSSLLNDLSALKVEGAAINGFVFGAAVKFDEDEKKFEVPENTIPVRITVLGNTIAATIDLAERIEAVEGFSNVRITRENNTAIILGTIPANKPPSDLVQRLLDLGVQFKAVTEKTEESAPETPADSEQTEESGQ